MSTPVESLIDAAATLGVRLDAAQTGRLLDLIAELARWNRSFNLTAVREPSQMIPHHLLDSLAAHPELEGTRVADVGTGAGFPGLPLALVNPARHFTLIDSNGKKIRFVAHAAHRMGLANVEPLHSRIEALRPAQAFETVIARALAPIPDLLRSIEGLSGPGTQVIAMKARRPDAELDALPAPWRVARERELQIPGLAAPRCLIVLVRTGVRAS